MKTSISLVVLLALATPLVAQTRGPAEFQLTRVAKNFVTAPQFAYSGAQQYATNQRDRWLEIEAEFAATPEFTDDLTLKYFVLVNGKVLTGEVTHTNIAAGREKRSVMYVSPRGLARAMGNRPLTPTSVANVAVQIVQQGAVRDELSSAKAAPQWFAALPQVAGLLLNKNETPFAPIYWDRYEQIKTPVH